MTLPQTTTAKHSLAEYHALIEAGVLCDRKVELLKGEISPMTPESPLHTVYEEGLANFLRSALKDRAWIREAHPITLKDSEPEPDFAVVKLPWSQYSQHHPYPDDIFWVIEIADSSLKKDLQEKSQIYAEAGISEYWVIEVKAQKITLFRQPNGETYNFKQEITTGNLTAPGFPDVKISLAKLFSGQISYGY